MKYDDHKDRSFVARYGATILRGGIAAIPSALYRYQGELGLQPQLVWFVSAILAHKWDSDMPDPSLKKLAAESGISRQQLHNYQRQLVQGGWLHVINQENAVGGKGTNIYDFSPLFAALEDLLERDKNRRSEAGQRETDLSTPHVNAGLHTHVNSAGHGHDNAGLHLKESVLEEPVKEEINISNIRKSTHSNNHFMDNTISQPVSVETQNGNHADSPARIYRGMEGVGDVLKRKRGRPRKFSDEASQTILNYVADFAREFADKATVNQSAARFINDFHKWGKGDMDSFIGVLYQARSITKSQNGVRNRFAYFAEVVEDLLGLKDEGANLTLTN